MIIYEHRSRVVILTSSLSCLNLDFQPQVLSCLHKTFDIRESLENDNSMWMWQWEYDFSVESHPDDFFVECTKIWQIIMICTSFSTQTPTKVSCGYRQCYTHVLQNLSMPWSIINSNTEMFLTENAFENDICEVSTTLFQSQWVNSLTPKLNNHNSADGIFKCPFFNWNIYIWCDCRIRHY